MLYLQAVSSVKKQNKSRALLFSKVIVKKVKRLKKLNFNVIVDHLLVLLRVSNHIKIKRIIINISYETAVFFSKTKAQTRNMKLAGYFSLKKPDLTCCQPFCTNF